jgi:hypothetical protein
MRLMNFSPSNNLVSVQTYSPYTGNYETDANSQFTFTYNMQPNGAGSPATAYAALVTHANVVPGSQSSHTWSGLTANKPYQWYVVLTTDEGDYSTSPEWNFKTTAGYSGFALIVSPDKNHNGVADDWETRYGIHDVTADDDADGQNNLAEYLAGTNPRDEASAFRIVESRRATDGTFSLTWTAVGGKRYRVQYAEGLTGGGTGEFVGIVRDVETETDASAAGTASTQSFSDVVPAGSARYYRVTIVQ